MCLSNINKLDSDILQGWKSLINFFQLQPYVDKIRGFTNYYNPQPGNHAHNGQP